TAPSGSDTSTAGDGSRSDGRTEGQRSHEVGGADEQQQSAGGGNLNGGTYQQLSFFLSENEQIRIIEEESSVKTPGSFSASEEDIEAALKSGTGFQGGKLRIYRMYQQPLSTKEVISFLK